MIPSDDTATEVARFLPGECLSHVELEKYSGEKAECFVCLVGDDGTKFVLSLRCLLHASELCCTALADELEYSSSGYSIRAVSL